MLFICYVLNMGVSGFLAPLTSVIAGWHQHRRRVRVLVHQGVFPPDSAVHLFIKVTNLSQRREVEITHIWLATQPPVYVLNPDRALPARLRLDETFETWIPAADLPDAIGVERLGRVLLSNGKVVKSRWNKRVPPVGNVAGSGSS